MLRRGLGVVAVLLVVAVGRADADGWPVMGGGGGGGGCASCGSSAPGGWVDESPLYPELTHWTFQKSHCRRLHIQCRPRWNECDPPYFPPLPYSARAYGYTGPAAAPAPATAPAAAPAPPAVPSPAEASVWGAP